MIWHVRSSDFETYLRQQGFRPVAQTATHVLWEHPDGRSFFMRRTIALTQQEVDIVSDANDLDPPQFETWFGG